MHVLEEVQNISPSQEEIKEYAEFLGIKDRKYYYIAEKGLNRKLPANWTAVEDKNDLIYYFNEVTKKSQWDHPNDQICKEEYENAKKNYGIQELSTTDDKNDILDLLQSDHSNGQKNKLVALPSTLDESDSVIIKRNLPPLVTTKKEKKSTVLSVPLKTDEKEKKLLNRKSSKIVGDNVENEMEPRWKTKTMKKIEQPTKRERPTTAEEIKPDEQDSSPIPLKEANKDAHASSHSLKKADSLTLVKVSSIHDITSRYKSNTIDDKERIELLIEEKFNSERANLTKEFEILQYKLELRFEKLIDDKLTNNDIFKDFIKTEIKSNIKDSIKELERTLCNNFNKDIKDLRTSIFSQDKDSSKRIIDDSFSVITNDMVEMQTEIKLMKVAINKQKMVDLEDVNLKIDLLKREVNNMQIRQNDSKIDDIYNDDEERLDKIRHALDEQEIPRMTFNTEDVLLDMEIPNDINHIEDKIEKHSAWLSSFLQKYQ